MANTSVEQSVKRFHDAEAALLSGDPPRATERRLAKLWDTTPKNVRRYLALVRRHWHAEGERDREQRKGEMRTRLLTHIDGAADVGEYNAVARMLETLAKLDGLLEPGSEGGDRVNLGIFQVVLEQHYGFGPIEVIDATPKPDALPEGGNGHNGKGNGHG